MRGGPPAQGPPFPPQAEARRPQARALAQKVVQFYQQRGAPPMALQRVHRRVVVYVSFGGDPAWVEQQVFQKGLPAPALLSAIEEGLRGNAAFQQWRAAQGPPGPGRPGGPRGGAWGAGRGGGGGGQTVVVKEIVKVPCKYCGTLMEVTQPKCPSCGAPLKVG